MRCVGEVDKHIRIISIYLLNPGDAPSSSVPGPVQVSHLGSLIPGCIHYHPYQLMSNHKDWDVDEERKEVINE